MPSRLTRRASARAAGLCALACTARAADTGFVDLSTTDSTPTGQVARTLLEPTTTDHLTSSLAGARSSSSATFHAGGKGKLSATSVTTPWIGGPGDGEATAGTWLVDVITFKVANAAPHKTRDVRITYSLSGEAAERSVQSVSDVLCIGTTDCSSVNVPAAVMAGADLPPASGVVSPVAGGGSVAPLLGPFMMSGGGMSFQIRGATAVVPIVLGLSVSSRGDSSWPGTGSIAGDYSWSIHMAADVTCTSRSGLAFHGRCPLAH